MSDEEHRQSIVQMRRAMIRSMRDQARVANQMGEGLGLPEVVVVLRADSTATCSAAVDTGRDIW